MRIGSCSDEIEIKNKKARKHELREELELLTSKGIVGHTKVGEAIGSEYVKDVSVLREAKPGIGLGRKLLEYAAGDGACVAGDGAELRQHHRASGHQSVEDRHRRRTFQKIAENVFCYSSLLPFLARSLSSHGNQDTIDFAFKTKTLK